jgi:hypothetical protein
MVVRMTAEQAAGGDTSVAVSLNAEMRANMRANVLARDVERSAEVHNAVPAPGAGRGESRWTSSSEVAALGGVAVA